MKTVLKLFRKSFGWPIFVWFGLFILWNAFVEYYEEMSPRRVKNIENLLVILDVLGILFKICFLGYLFRVAGRIASNTPSALSPIGFKNSLVVGIRVVFRLIFISLPLASIVTIGAWLNRSDVSLFCYYYTLFYVVFLIVPFFLHFVANIERFPILDDILPFFRKNMNNCFAFIVCSAFSYVVWFHLTEFIFKIGQVYSTSFAALVVFTLTPYFLLFYTMFFNAVLLGFFAGRSKEIVTEAVIEKVEVKKKNSSPKKVNKRTKK